MSFTQEYFADFATTTVNGGAGGVSTPLNSGDTTLYLPTPGLALMPASVNFRLLIGQPISGSGEIVLVTAAGSNPYTIVRAQEGTSAQNWPVGTNVQLMLSATQLGNIMTTLALLLTQSSVATPSSNGTIATSGVSVARVNPSGAVTGMILGAGAQGGQQVQVVNESSNTLTFAASGTSNVADGVSDVIAANAAKEFVWDSGTSLWYPSGGGASGSSTLAGDSDVSITSPSNGQLLTYSSGSSKWTNQTSSAASTGDHYVVGYNGQNDTDLTNKIVIPSMLSNPNIRVAGTNDDEFDQHGAGTPSGWTTFGSDSPVADTNTAYSMLHMTCNSAGSTHINGIYKAAPSIPYTVTCHVADWNSYANFIKSGLVILDGTSTGKAVMVGLTWNSGSSPDFGPQTAVFDLTNWTTWNANLAAIGDWFPYLRFTVHAANNIDCLISRNGLSYYALQTGISYLSNATYVGPALDPGTGVPDGYWDWIRFS